MPSGRTLTPVAKSFAVAGVYAWGLLRGRNGVRHRSAITIAMALAASTAALQLVTLVQHAGNFTRIETLAEHAAPSGARAARDLYRDVQLARADHGLPIRWDTA